MLCKFSLFKSFLIIMSMFIAASVVGPLKPVAGSAYSDNHTSWFADELNDLIEKGILNGLYGETFDSNKAITRGEFAQLIQNSRELATKDGGEASFTDVRKEDRYYLAISALVDSGIINGYQDGTFRPQKHLTRAEIAKVISRAYEIDANDEDVLSFEDVKRDHWAARYVSGLVNAGIITGISEKKYAPDQKLTWAQAVVIVHRAIENQNKTSLDTPNHGSEIKDVISLSSDGRYLEVTFSEPLEKIEQDQFKIYNASSLDLRGIQEVKLAAGGKKAILTMYKGARLETLTEYVIEFESAGIKSSFPFYREEYIQLNNVEIIAVEVKEREITIGYEEDEEKKLFVPESIDLDFVAAFNREATVWYNREGDLTLYEFKNEEKDVKKAKKFINQFELNDYIFVEEIDQQIATGINGEIHLEDYDVFVKSHKTIKPEDIQPGDLLLFNSKEGIVEVCTNLVTGKIDHVYKDGIDIAAKDYDYTGHYVDKDGDLENFDSDAAEKLQKAKEVTVFLDKDDNIVLIK